jgi:hypothetical protein
MPSTIEIKRRDQCVPPSASETFRQSLMGRKTCVVREKSGNASRSECGFGVCRIIKDMLGRRRTMLDDLNSVRNSRSKYLGQSVMVTSYSAAPISNLLLPERYNLVVAISQLRNYRSVILFVSHTNIIRKPVILERL